MATERPNPTEAAPTPEPHKYMVVTRTLVVDSEGRILLLKRKNSRKIHNPGKEEFPGGRFESGDWATSAADREALEEAKIRVIPLSALYAIHTKFVTEGRHKNTCYVEMVNVSKLYSGIAQVRKPGDHVSCRWVPAQELFKLETLSPEAEGAFLSLVPELERLEVLPKPR